MIDTTTILNWLEELRREALIRREACDAEWAKDLCQHQADMFADTIMLITTTTDRLLALEKYEKHKDITDGLIADFLQALAQENHNMGQAVGAVALKTHFSDRAQKLANIATKIRANIPKPGGDCQHRRKQ